MPVSRMRMRPWLEEKIDSNTIAGLVWVDKEKKMFSIPWKHAARHGWEMDKDACLFKQWAIHTGKYKQGFTDPDPKTWKANFRCAMNSLPDIEEVKDKSINKGCEAVRVYRMLQAVKNKGKRSLKIQDGRRKRKAPKVKKMDADEITTKDLYSHNQDDRITQENTIDSTENMNTTSPTYDVPDCSGYEVEIGPDSTNDIYRERFQVSPVHTTEYEEKAIVEISRQLELDSSQWLQSSSSGKGFLCNEVAMTESYHSTDSYHSPESQWSDISGEELELRFYTELIPGLPSEEILSYTDMWNSNPHTTGLPQISCLL